MSNISRGTQQPVVNAETISYSPQGGWVFAGNIGGVKENVRALVYQLAAAGYSFRYTCEQSPLANISYETGGDPGGGGGTEQPTLVWEYFANTSEIDIMEANIPGASAGGPPGQGAVNAISDEDRKLIRREIQGTEGELIDFGDPNADSLLSLMLKGVKSYRVDQPILRRSMVVSNTYAVQASQDNVRRIFSSAKLALDESVPTRLFDLPVESPPANKPGFIYGWYKKFPTIQQAAGGRWNVSQEWEYGLWPTFIYGNAITT